MMEEVIAISLFVVCLAIAVFTQGCSTQVDKVISLESPVKCRSINLPPVPQDVVIDIKGDKITANAGGQTLLHGYVACRSLSR